MARTPYATEIHDTPQKSGRNPVGPPTYIVLHHAATKDFDAVVALENGGKQVSSTVVIKDSRCASMFDEAWRAWSLSSQYWDSVSLSSETCNESYDGWTISEASYKTLAKVVADWCRRYNIPCDRTHIMGHREVYTRYGDSYATACPGGLDLDRVVREAKALLTAPAKLETEEIKLTKQEIQDIMSEIRYYTKTEGGQEWGLMGRELDGGWLATTDVKQAEAWGMLYGRTDEARTGAPFTTLPLGKWRKTQETARAMNAAWKAEKEAERKDLALKIAQAIKG